MSDDSDVSLQRRLLQSLQGHSNLQTYASEVFAEDALLRRLLAAVDESVFGPVDWIEALILLSEWLDERGLDLSLEDRIDYVGCVAEAGSAGMRMEDLPSIIRDMLATYGCERAIKKS
jgi:hypothetical protein